jgi:Ca2+-binding EF-hand superfamily protein
MHSKYLALALIAAIPAAGQAQQKPAADAPQSITRDQISAQLDSDYADLDTDKDGKVGDAEIKARLKKGAEADLETLRKERDAAFAKFDADGNGTISRAEFDARAQLPTIKEADAKPFLDRFDGNKDGAITKDEFRAPTLANFAKMDSNKDGTLTAAEQSAAAAAAKKKATVQQTPPIGR